MLDRLISEKNLIKSGFKLMFKGVIHDEYIGFIGDLNGVRYYFKAQRSISNNLWHYQIVTFENHETVYKLIGAFDFIKTMRDIFRIIREFKEREFPVPVPQNLGIYSSYISNKKAKEQAMKDMEKNQYRLLAFRNPRTITQCIPKIEVIPISKFQ